MSSEMKEPSKKREIEWILVLVHLQVFIILGFGIHAVAFQALWKTLIFTSILVILANLGMTAGAHRLWAHQSYKASTELKVFLMLCHTLAGTGSIHNWVKLHRLHHKHFETDLDPYDTTKGFFYSHFTSYCLDLSPAQTEALKEIDISDMEKDKVVAFQHKYYWYMFVIITLLLPINAPAEYWGESLTVATLVTGLVRWSVVFHLSLLIHSATKILGLEPGEKYPSDTNLIFIMSKNYWLSYHHLAPWDYQTGEYGQYGTDWTTTFIRVCAALDAATDLKTCDSSMIRSALVQSVDDKRPISECILEQHRLKNMDTDHLLMPAKFL